MHTSANCDGVLWYRVRSRGEEIAAVGWELRERIWDRDLGFFCTRGNGYVFRSCFAKTPAGSPSQIRASRRYGIGNIVNEFDLIFVLAGRSVRKIYGLELFRAGVAPRILFSVARFEVRRFRELGLPVEFDLLPIALPVPAEERHFFVLFGGGAPEVERIAVRRFGTLREIEALGGYLGRHREIRSVLVVTSAVHLRRVRLCCRVILPREIHFQMAAVPRVGKGVRDGVGSAGYGESVVGVTADAGPACGNGATQIGREARASFLEFVTEMAKLAGYRVLLGFRGRTRV